jgi:hypothetical protein
MLTGLTALGERLVTWASTHRQASLAQYEERVLTEVWAVLPDLLRMTVEIGLADLDARQRLGQRSCPACGRATRVHSWRSRRAQTTCGVLRLPRPWFHCSRCRRGFSPVDATLGLTSGAHLSTALRHQIVDLGATTTFAEAARLLRELTGQSVAAETIRQHTEQVGTALEAEQQAQTVQVLRTQEAAAPLEPVPGTLLVEADGVMVRYADGWHEAKVGVIAGWDGQHSLAPSYVAAREGPDCFGPRLLAEAARRGALEVVGWEQPPGIDQRLAGVVGPSLAVLRPALVLGDGAPWIWNLAAEHFGERTELVDWYHSSQHLWSAGKALHGEDTPATVAWVRARHTLLWEQGAQELLTALTADLKEAPAAAQVSLQRERGYFLHNRTRLDYAGARAARQPIGSGAVESACKHLVQQRLKRPGARWSPRGAQAVLTLRAHLSSRRPLP